MLDSLSRIYVYYWLWSYHSAIVPHRVSNVIPLSQIFQNRGKKALALPRGATSTNDAISRASLLPLQGRPSKPLSCTLMRTAY